MSPTRKDVYKRQVKAHLIDDAEKIDPAWLDGVERIGVTAGASAPEVLVKNVVDKLSGGQTGQVRQLDGVEELSLIHI